MRSLNLRGQALAATVLSEIYDLDAPRGIMLKALSYSKQHFENRTIVETALAVANCHAEGFRANNDLELYFDLSKNGKDVAFISKGWDDPGYRIGELITIQKNGMYALDNQLNTAKQFCDTNGIVMTIRNIDETVCEVMLDCVIYSSGFDGRTLAQVLSTLTECATKLKKLTARS